MDLLQIHQRVIKLIPSINERLRLGFYKTNKVSYKTSPHLSISVVTHLDSKIENFLKKELKPILPQAGFIGEETGINLQSEFNWVIDPIDGTLNFANKIPIFAVSLALWCKNDPVYALTSFPMQNEIVHAFKNGGIFLNQKKIQPKSSNLPTTMLLYQIVGDPELKQRIFKEIIQLSPRPRNFGSCVFHGSYAALGRVDAAVFINQALWDIGAIILLTQEAGLTIHWLSPQPDLSKDNLKKYQYSVIIGQKDLVI